MAKVPYYSDELVRSVSLTTILLPAELDVGFPRVSEHFLQAHNLKVVGSNPTPATKNSNKTVVY